MRWFPELCWGWDIAYLLGTEGGFDRILPITLEDEWLVPHRYLRELADSAVFHHNVRRPA